MNLSEKNKDLVSYFSEAHKMSQDDFLNMLIKLGFVGLMKELEFYGSMDAVNNLLSKLQEEFPDEVRDRLS